MNEQEQTERGAEAAGGGSIFRERLMRDAEKVTQKDIDELEESVPKKLAGFDLKGLDDTVSWVGTLVGRVRTMLDMLRDRDFRLNRKTVALIAAGLVYFVLPTDFTPDFIPGIGYLDDAIVLNIVWRAIAEQVDRYAAFRAGQDAGSDTSA